MSLRRLLNRSAAVSFVAFALIFPLFFTAGVRAQDTCSQSYIDSLPVPTPIPPAVKVVQLVNCTNQVILGAANAAHQPRQPGFPILPREGTWVMQPYNTPGSILTIDVPPQWTQTKCAVGVTDCPALGPIFWPRTGCRYDAASNRAQCETGGCAGQYDCSSGAWGPPGFTSIAEWTFIDKYSNNFDFPDISLVNGGSINLDIEPVGGSDSNPTDRFDQHWLKFNYPLTVHGADLRTEANCPNSETGNKFLLKRSDIDKSGLYGYVIVDQNGDPTMPPGDNPLACLSNCGYYKYPVEEDMKCNARTSARCYAWKTFCAGDPSLYGKKCKTEQDCVTVNNGLDIHASCWNREGGSEGTTCELRGFYRNQASLCNGGNQDGSPASKIACTFLYGSINPLSSQKNYADQPPTGQPPTNILCKDVIGPDGKQAACVGDDTLHKVFHGAYTWPNDPEVYVGDAKLYRIVFAPGGTTIPITPAENGIPLCEDLPANYNYSDNYGPGGAKPCSAPVDNEGAVFAVANPKKGKIWACNLDQRGAGDEGVICRWHPAPADCSDYGTNTCVPCSPPITDTNVTASACGAISSGTTVKASFMTPNANDPLFLEVTIPQVQNPVRAPTGIRGCASWSLVRSATINTNQGFVAWYRGVATNGQQCQVSITMANGNPAAIKVYDVPKYNGTLETTSAAAGNFVPNGAFAIISAGTATTSGQNDLVLGDLLQVNQQYTPITYWVDWLTNSDPTLNNVNCVNGYLNCPTDDATDYLPGHGPYSSNAEAGHQMVGPGQHWLWRHAQGLGKFGWGGVAIYIQLNP